MSKDIYNHTILGPITEKDKPMARITPSEAFTQVFSDGRTFTNGERQEKVNTMSKKDEIIKALESFGSGLPEGIKKNDPVNHPSHYTFGKYEVIDVLEDWFADDPLIWQVGKYIARYKHKQVPLQDLKKAEFYLKRKITQLEKEGDK